ncbi:MAG: hypothetical protein WCK33_03805 [Phycisphaerae bacterium]
MKNVLDWIKSNLLIVIFSVVTLLVLPLSYFFSMKMRVDGLEDRKKQAATAYDAASRLEVSYALPGTDASGKPIEVKGPPNTRLTEWFAQRRKAMAQSVGAVTKVADDFNQGIGSDAAAVGRSEFKPFVDGLFPSVASIFEHEAMIARGKAVVDAMPAEQRAEELKAMSLEQLHLAKGKEEFDKLDEKGKADAAKAVAEQAREVEQKKLADMEDSLLGKRGKPNPYEAMLAAAGAGAPADVVRVADSLRDMNTREIEKITAGKRALTNEEQAALAKQLAERRLAEYQAAAKGFSFYATLESLPRDRNARSIARGRIAPEQLNAVEMFLYQWDVWVLQDVLAAAKFANSVDGRPLEVERAVVKRIESIALADPEGLYAPKEESAGGAPAATPPAAETTPGSVPLDFTRSVTGRASSPANTLYDVRRVTVQAVVASNRLAEFLDAITKVNFMTVTRMDVRDVDVWQDLKEGYFYGNDHVVRVTLDIESLWLRSWTTKYMPHEILSVLSSASSGDAASAAPAAAPPPSPQGGKGRGRAPGRG